MILAIQHSEVIHREGKVVHVRLGRMDKIYVMDNS